MAHPKVRRSERQTKLSRARSVVDRRHTNSRLDAVVSSREGKNSLLRRDVVPAAACSKPTAR